MTLGGLCLSGCCGCQLLYDTFQRAADTTNLGAPWKGLRGDTEILDRTLTMTAGSAIAWTGGYTTFMGSFWVYFSSIAAGTVFRIYLGAPSTTTVPTTNYVEYTYQPWSSVSGAPQSTLTAVGLSTRTVTAPEVPAGETDGSSEPTGSSMGFGACIGQVGSTYRLIGSNASRGPTGAGADPPDSPIVNMLPAGTHVVLQMVSGSAAARINLAYADDMGDITCPAPGAGPCSSCWDCNSSCGCDHASLSVTIAGVPSACGSLNGAYTLDCDSIDNKLTSLVNKCLFVYRYAGDWGQPAITFSYNPLTDQSTVVGLISVDYLYQSIYYSKTVSGTITCADLAGLVLTYQRGSGGAGCQKSDLADSTITITAVTGA
ncbi:MAG TPA: hypothetical protein VIK18_10665 [Pirellulales bacterium]